MNGGSAPRRDPAAAKKRTRRRLLQGLLFGAAAVAAALSGFVPVLAGWIRRLRPPGALEESRFLAACIKCGQCVQVCPVEAIRLADAGDGLGLGTPYLEARTQACDFSCDVMQCVLACPTGALSHEIDFPHQTRMGIARLTRPESCLAVQGLGVSGPARGEDFAGRLRYSEVDRWSPIEVREHPYELESCDLCVRQCPIELQLARARSESSPLVSEAARPPASAIRMTVLEDGGSRPEVLEGCVGCGVCEMICPAEPAAITVEPAVDLRGRA